MKKIMMLLIIFTFFTAFTYAQVPEGQPQHQEQQYEEQEQEQLENEAPEQQPQSLEQEGEQEGEQEQEFGDNEFTDKFSDAKTMNFRKLPDAVKNNFESGYFSDWEIIDVYRADEVLGDEPVPSDYILKVQKEDTRMHLYYQSNGELMMQEKAPLTEKI